MLPGQDDRLSFPAAALNGGLVLDHGRIEPDVEWEKEYAFRRFHAESSRRQPLDRGLVASNLYSNVHRVMLGMVSTLELTGVSKTGKTIKRTFDPIDREVEIWVRHFCKVGVRPDSEYCEEDPFGAWDGDFILNYMLHGGTRRKIRDQEQDELLYPQAGRSWLSNNPVGDCPSECLCSGSGNRENLLDDID